MNLFRWPNAVFLLAWAVPLWAGAQALSVDNAWIRPTVPGQQGTGGFMTLKSSTGVTITGVSAPASIGVAELHEMAMVGDVMQMRALSSLVVAAGQPVELKSGGYHLMLVGLKAPLVRGTQVPVTFRYKDSQGKTGQLEVKIPVDQRLTNAPGHGHAR